MELPEKQPDLNSRNPLHNEHLSDDIKPIFVCIDYDDSKVIELFDDDEAAIDVDHYAACIGISSLNVVTNETSKIGVVSSLDTTNKFSAEFRNCIGLIAIGAVEPNLNKSLLLHIDPVYFKSDYNRLTEIVSEKLKQLQAESAVWSIDTLIFGGRIPDTTHAADFEYELDHYQNAISILGEIVNQTLGFESIVIPPKPLTHKIATTVYLDTNNRRLYLAQTALERSSLQKPFLASQVHSVTPKYINPLIASTDIKGGWED